MTKIRLAIGVIATTMLAALFAAPAQAQTTFAVVSAPAAIAAQPTDGGRMIVDLGVDDGKIYPGYGDWTTNTGPIDVISYNTATGETVTELDNVPTEALWAYRTIDGDLYAPWTDPLGGGSGTYSTNKGGTWHNVYGPFGVHWFDITENDGTLIVAGSMDGGDGAVAYASKDGGSSWSMVASDVNDPPNGWERYYWAVTTEGRSYMQARDDRKAFPLLRSYDGVNWSSRNANAFGHPSAHLTEGYKGMVVSPTYVLKGNKTLTSGLSCLGCSGIEDFFQYGGYLYAVGDLGVYRTDGSATKGNHASLIWDRVGDAPTDAESLAIVDGYAYFGMRDGTITKASVPLS